MFERSLGNSAENLFLACLRTALHLTNTDFQHRLNDEHFRHLQNYCSMDDYCCGFVVEGGANGGVSSVIDASTGGPIPAEEAEKSDLQHDDFGFELGMLQHETLTSLAPSFRNCHSVGNFLCDQMKHAGLEMNAGFHLIGLNSYSRRR
jgi:hypothetical protein